MTILHDAMWQAPRELSGVKSRKRAVFEIPLGSMDAASNAGIHRVSGLKVSLESRISALGSGGRVAVELLLGRPLKGQVHRHEELQVAHLSSNLAGDEATVGEHLEAVKSILETRLDMLAAAGGGFGLTGKCFLDRCIPDAAAGIQAKEALRGFRGAIVLVVDEESEAIKEMCSQRWRQGGSWLWQQKIPQSVACFSHPRIRLNATKTDELEQMLQKVRELSAEAFFGEDSVEKSGSRGWSLCLLVDQAACDASRFCGFMCYQLSAKNSEFHIARIAVIARSRGKGYGKHFMQWALEKCSFLPRSTCAWISLSALDEAVPFYEHFGFTDMTCDDLDDDKHIQTWMELKNISVPHIGMGRMGRPEGRSAD
ncbi:Protein TAPT1-like [Durusdinium trenchii]|uniref:Protein TAPT1-like n=1 Tax=Durusdinium trenchii TaxID=1381693 RepID=A0ABP0IAG6_9DINO